jgi:4-diphosphocytidyl-2C-methyl-D-erythritol kinase
LCLTSRCQTSNIFKAGGHDAATCSRIQLTISGPASHNQTHLNCNSWYGHPEVVRHACEERNTSINKSRQHQYANAVARFARLQHSGATVWARGQTSHVGQQSHAHWASATSFLSHLASCHNGAHGMQLCTCLSESDHTVLPS